MEKDLNKVSVPTTSHGANSIASVYNGDLSIAVQESIHTIADQSAALCAEKGTCRIDRDEVKNCLEELLPSAEILLKLNNQAAAKPYFTEEGWLTVESVLRILEDQYLKQIKRKEFPSNVSQKKGKGKKSPRKNCFPTKDIESEGNERKRDVPDIEDNICNDKDGNITFFPDIMPVSSTASLSLLSKEKQKMIFIRTMEALKTVDEKEREILSRLVSVDSVMTALGGTLLVEDDLVGLSADSLPDRCLDDYVDLTIVQKFFISSAWLYLLSIVKEKQQKGGYIFCTYCNVFITIDNDDAVECNFCLL
ncbi:unnamed protein product [Mytilus coruscus]|uniref:Uncharacterized protein n=1 Tax=Mytilus coruscus TaxID=42192 RepID=A0A6J8AFL9_MYTCO|nr:unnamed protein product [Mytilus coruscus]